MRIGNSHESRIPKLLLQQTGLGEEVELNVQDDEIVIRPARHPAQGWHKAFREMARRGDDRLLDEQATDQSNWDKVEWEW